MSGIQHPKVLSSKAEELLPAEKTISPSDRVPLEVAYTCPADAVSPQSITNSIRNINPAILSLTGAGDEHPNRDSTVSGFKVELSTMTAANDNVGNTAEPCEDFRARNDVLNELKDKQSAQNEDGFVA